MLDDGLAPLRVLAVAVLEDLEDAARERRILQAPDVDEDVLLPARVREGLLVPGLLGAEPRLVRGVGQSGQLLTVLLQDRRS